jgi:hypothetical protein
LPPAGVPLLQRCPSSLKIDQWRHQTTPDSSSWLTDKTFRVAIVLKVKGG